MKICLFIFIFALTFKFLSNSLNYYKIKRLRAMHTDWINDKNDDYDTYKVDVITLFKKAKIQNQTYRIGKSLGFNAVLTNVTDVFQNFPCKDPTLAAAADSMFAEAIGFFRKNMRDCFNPLYWIDLIIFCPKHILEYIDLDMNKSNVKILNTVLNALWWFFDIIFLCFQSEAKAFIIKLLR